MHVSNLTIHRATSVSLERCDTRDPDDNTEWTEITVCDKDGVTFKVLVFDRPEWLTSDRARAQKAEEACAELRKQLDTALATIENVGDNELYLQGIIADLKGEGFKVPGAERIEVLTPVDDKGAA